MCSNYILILCLLLIPIFCFSQEVQADKYKDAYKKYENASCPLPGSNIKHFVYFARDREAITDHPFLKNPAFQGAQIMYSWRELEKTKDVYDLSPIRTDYEYLKKHGKKLFIQLQDATFNPNNKGVPDYLLSDEYEGGVVIQYTGNGQHLGWAAKRWNKKVRERFFLLMQTIGREFDGRIDGINLQETAMGLGRDSASGREEAYVIGLKQNMLALKKAFPSSVTMIYANFIPGEFLPWNDKGYLRSIYQYGEEIGVGLGGPDLMVTRRAQLNHTLKMMHEHNYKVPLGIAVQDGNYTAQTGADPDYDENASKTKIRKNLVPLLYHFAADFLKVNYIFWTHQEPYFTEDLVPCLR